MFLFYLLEQTLSIMINLPKNNGLPFYQFYLKVQFKIQVVPFEIETFVRCDDSFQMILAIDAVFMLFYVVLREFWSDFGMKNETGSF